MAGWPSHLDLPAREDDGTSWNKRVDAHGLSVELLDAMWYAAAVDHQSGYKQKCLRWIGPYFPGTTAEERKVQIVETEQHGCEREGRSAWARLHWDVLARGKHPV